MGAVCGRDQKRGIQTVQKVEEARLPALVTNSLVVSAAPPQKSPPLPVQPHQSPPAKTVRSDSIEDLINDVMGDSLPLTNSKSPASHLQRWSESLDRCFRTTSQTWTATEFCNSLAEALAGPRSGECTADISSHGCIVASIVPAREGAIAKSMMTLHAQKPEVVQLGLELTARQLSNESMGQLTMTDAVRMLLSNIETIVQAQRIDLMVTLQPTK